ncbi:Putative ribonuclease H protein At1g65750 [Linum perenne]
MSPPRDDAGEDGCIWGAEDSGQFSIKSAYRIACDIPSQTEPGVWGQVWKWKGPHRIRLFLWLAIQEKLLTNCSRVRRHLTADASCGRCNHPEESVSHVLRDCVFAAESWSKLEGFDLSSNLWQEGTETWIKKGLSMENSLLFGTHCWMLWKTRNEHIFAGNTSTPLGVAMRSIHWVRQVASAMELNRRTLDVGPSRGTRGGSRATAGGLVRDHEGRCLNAFTMNLGACSITRAEMRGAIEGLTRAWSAGYRRIRLQIDSKAVIAALSNGDTMTSRHAMEISQFQDLVERDWLVTVEHTYREGNQAADFLASIGYGYPIGSHTFDISDSRLGYFLRLDCFGVGFPRSVLIND